METSSSREYFLSEFSKALETNTAAIFAGAGLSIGAGYPSWAELVAGIASQLGLPASDDLVTLAQFAVNRDRNRSLVNKRIVEEFNRRRTPTDVHRQLARLPIDTYWTTNYDSLLENAIREVGRVPDVKRRQDDLPRLIPDRTATVFKMHGDADSPQEAVLVRDDYEDYARERELFVDTLTADLLMKTFLFTGVSFTDPNLNFLLGRLRSIYEGARKEHFWIAKKPAATDPGSSWFEYRIDDLQRYGIRTVVLDEHNDLTVLLDRLRLEYDKRRRRRAVFFSGALNDDDPNADQVRHFAQLLAEKVISRGMTIITGVGRGLGSHITTAALDVIYRIPRTAARPDQLIARPFPVGFGHSVELSTTHRKRMIGEAGFAVFISGRGEQPSGVREEYEIAKNSGCYTIPVGATGNDAAELWQEAYQQLDELFGRRRPKVERSFLQLSQSPLSPEAAVDAVDQIISALQD